MTKEQHKLLVGEGWTLGRAMRGLPSDPDEIRGPDGFTSIDSVAYIKHMCERLLKGFPGMDEEIKWLEKKLIAIRGYTSPEEYGNRSAQALHAFAGMAAKKI